MSKTTNAVAVENSINYVYQTEVKISVNSENKHNDHVNKTLEKLLAYRRDIAIAYVEFELTEENKSYLLEQFSFVNKNIIQVIGLSTLDM